MATVDVAATLLTRAALPPVCAVTGERAETARNRTVVKAPTWTLVFLLLGVIPYVVLRYVIGVKIQVAVPESAARAGLRRNLTVGAIVSALTLFVAPAAVIPFSEALAGVLVLAALPATLVTVVWRERMAPGLRFDGETVTFQKVHDTFAAAVHQWTAALQAPPAPPAGWYPDPSGQHEHRYFDGQSWTAHVSTYGQAGLAPIG